MDMQVSDRVDSVTPVERLCRLGTHCLPAGARKNAHCPQCAKGKLKTGRRHVYWDGTLAHLFKIPWIRIEGRHWIWIGGVNKTLGRPFIRWHVKSHYPHRLIWQLTGNPLPADGRVLMHDGSRCPHPRCVHPLCHVDVKRGEQLTSDDRARGLKARNNVFGNMTLDEAIEVRILRDDSGCHKWTGYFSNVTKGYPLLRYHHRIVNVRRYLWDRDTGTPLVGDDILKHRQHTGCSSPKACANSAHMEVTTRREWAKSYGTFATASPERRHEFAMKVARARFGCAGYGLGLILAPTPAEEAFYTPPGYDSES